MGELEGLDNPGSQWGPSWDMKNFGLSTNENDLFVIQNSKTKITGLNMFSSPLSVQRMVAMTNGEGECGRPGDLVSWAEANWVVENNATMIHLNKDIYSPCSWSSLSMFYFNGTTQLKDCMQHCQKLEHGRSPAVGSFEEWARVKKEMESMKSDTMSSHSLKLWLAVTEGDVGGRLHKLPHWPATENLGNRQTVPLDAKEGVWRDYYTGARVDVLSDGQRMDPNKNDTVYGEDFNCMTVKTIWSTQQHQVKWDPWVEKPCHGTGHLCLCEFDKQPVVTLRGLCLQLIEEKMVDSMFIAQQLPPHVPLDLYWQDHRHTTIRFDKKSNLT